MRPDWKIAKGLIANVNLTRGDCEDLPAYQDREQGFFLSRWRLTWKERLAVLFGGSIWLYVLSAGHPPIAMAAREKDVI